MHKGTWNCIIKNIIKTIIKLKPIENKIVVINSKIIIKKEIPVKKIETSKQNEIKTTKFIK